MKTGGVHNMLGHAHSGRVNLLRFGWLTPIPMVNSMGQIVLGIMGSGGYFFCVMCNLKLPSAGGVRGLSEYLGGNSP